MESIAIDSILFDEFKQIIKSYSKFGKVCLQYDTTFNLSGFYVSVLTFIHPLLVNDHQISPPIPIAYYYHEKKYLETHETFWKFFNSKIGNLINSIFIITDCEDAIRSAIKNNLDGVRLLRCWKHLWNNIRDWARSNLLKCYQVK